MSVTPGKGAPWQAVLGAGGVLGVSSGYAAKKIGKAALFATGVAVLFLQFLASRGVISVDWTRVGDKVTEQLDADGDGKLTHRDLGVGLRAMIKFASQRMPFASLFGVGFLVGWRYG